MKTLVNILNERAVEIPVAGAMIADRGSLQPSLLSAEPGDLSHPEEERMDEASAALDDTSDGIWNYASHRTLDFSQTPDSPDLRRIHAWHFGVRFGL